MNAETLTPRQIKVVGLLLAAPSVEAACAAAKIAKPTVYAWMKQTNFRAALKQAQDEAFSHAVGKLKANVSKAAAKLVLLVESEDAGIALRASVAVIEHAAKLAVAEDIEQRLAMLENRIAAKERSTL